MSNTKDNPSERSELPIILNHKHYKTSLNNDSAICLNTKNLDEEKSDTYLNKKTFNKEKSERNYFSNNINQLKKENTFNNKIDHNDDDDEEEEEVEGKVKHKKIKKSKSEQHYRKRRKTTEEKANEILDKNLNLDTPNKNNTKDFNTNSLEKQVEAIYTIVASVKS